MKRLWQVMWFVLAAAATVQAQIGGPVLGRFTDGTTNASYAIYGVPGASLVDTDRNQPDLRILASATEAAIVTGISPDSSTLQLADLTRAGSQALPGVEVTPDTRVAVSPSGKALAVYRLDSQSVVTARSLRSSSPLVDTADLAEAPANLAVSDDGDLLFTGAISGSTWLVRRGASPEWLTNMASPLFVFGATGEAILYSAATGELFRISGGTANRSLQAVAVSDVAVLQGGKHLAFDSRQNVIVLAREGGDISLILAGGESVSVLKCSCAPQRLTRLSRAGVYLLTDVQHQTVWMLDLGTSGPRLVFAPQPGGLLER